MTAEEKRERNREYYEKRKEELRKKARERYRKLKLVEELPEEKAESIVPAPPPILEICEPKKKRKQNVSLVRKTIRPISIKPQRLARDFQSLDSEKLKNEIAKASEKKLSDYGPRFFSTKFQLSDGELLVATNFKQQQVALVSMDSEGKSEKKPEKTKKQNFSVSYFQFFSQFFRIVFGAGLTWLLILLQVEFYESHDPSKYSVALAIACELSLIALSMPKFRCWLTQWIKQLTYFAVFCYIVGSLGFASYHSQREILKQATPIGQNKEHLISSLRQAEESLAQATKHRSWDNMKLFGSQVEELRKEIKEFKPPKPMGFSNEEIALFTALLFIMLRAGFVIVNSLNAVKIKEEFEEWVKLKGCQPLNT